MKVIEDLKRHEGFRSKPYRDTEGYLTIGYGINLNKGISELEATLILVHRVKIIQDVLSKKLIFWNYISSARQDVLINMAYNLGIDGLMKFEITLDMIAKENYIEASVQMLKSKWAKQVGNRAKELSIMMREG